MAQKQQDWMSTALRFMGDGQRGVGRLIDDASSGLFTKMSQARKKVKAKLKSPAAQKITETGDLLDRLSVQFSRPFGLLRYATSFANDLSLEQFKAELIELGNYFDQLTELVSRWLRLADQADKGSAGANSTSLKEQIINSEKELIATIDRIKKRISIDQRVQKSYQEWDACLAKFIASKDPLWISLRQISLGMKRDAFSDIESWKDTMKAWRSKAMKSRGTSSQSDLSSAGAVLENYCKLKHLQKVMSLW